VEAPPLFWGQMVGGPTIRRLPFFNGDKVGPPFCAPPGFRPTFRRGVTKLGALGSLPQRMTRKKNPQSVPRDIQNSWRSLAEHPLGMLRRVIDLLEVSRNPFARPPFSQPPRYNPNPAGVGTLNLSENPTPRVMEPQIGNGLPIALHYRGLTFPEIRQRWPQCPNPGNLGPRIPGTGSKIPPKAIRPCPPSK